MAQTRESDEVFILGAGFSKSIDKRMPLMQELGQALILTLPEATRTEIPFLAEDFELGLTYLSEGHPGMSEPELLRNRALFLEITTKIANILEDRTSAVRESLECAWLSRFVHYLHDKQAAVVTMNYDTLLEFAFSRIAVSDTAKLGRRCVLGIELQQAPGTMGWNRVLTATLLKLHGSTDWYYSGSESYFGEPICDHSLPGKVPLILPPVASKNAYLKNEQMRGQWTIACNALARAKRISCLGYSLPPTDLTVRFLPQTPRQRPAPFYVVDRDKSRVEHFRGHLPKSLEVQESFAGGDDCIERFTAMLENELLAPQTEVDDRANGFRKLLSDAKIERGSTLTPVGRASTITVELCDGHGLVVRDAEGILCRIPWECFDVTLELLAKEREPSSPCQFKEIDEALAGIVTRHVSRTVVAVLERIGRANYVVKYNTEYVKMR